MLALLPQGALASNQGHWEHKREEEEEDSPPWTPGQPRTTLWGQPVALQSGCSLWQGLGWPAKETQGSLCDWGLVDTGPHQSRRAKDPPATTRVDHSPGQPNLHASKQPSGPRSQALSLSALAFNRLTVGQPHAGALSPVT